MGCLGGIPGNQEEALKVMEVELRYTEREMDRFEKLQDSLRQGRVRDGVQRARRKSIPRGSRKEGCRVVGAMVEKTCRKEGKDGSLQEEEPRMFDE